MRKNQQEQAVSPEREMELTLDDLVRRGARQVIQQAIETELAELLASCAHVRTLARQASCRAQRALLTEAGQSTGSAEIRRLTHHATDWPYPTSDFTSSQESKRGELCKHHPFIELYIIEDNI